MPHRRVIAKYDMNLYMAEDHKGALAVSQEGIEIWNRSWDTYKDRLFPDDANAISMFAIGARLKHAKFWANPQYWFTPAFTKYEEDGMRPEIITAKKPILGLRTIFAPDRTVMDIGCGGGAAAIGMAREFRKNKILAVDYELGKEIPFPLHKESNLEFRQEDWRAFSLSDDSVDSFVSDQGIARYGNKESIVTELTRIAKVGAVFRGTQTRGIYGVPNFNERLAQAGWDVWHLRNPGGGVTQLIMAELKRK